MLFLKFVVSLGAYLIVQLMWVKSALAWGPGVHTVTALSVLDDVQLLLPFVARTLTSFPLQYLYGCLSADFFIGKTKKAKTRHLHNWEGGFTLLRGRVKNGKWPMPMGSFRIWRQMLSPTIFLFQTSFDHFPCEAEWDICIGR